MKKLLLLTLATLVATGLLPMTAASADGPSDEASFVARINSLRASKGLSALVVHAVLTSKARGWAQTMADKNMLSHSVLSDGNTADWQRLGENVGRGATVAGLDAAFVVSPLHYKNLVDPAFGSIGLGVVRGAGGVIFVAEEFMQLRTAAVAPAAVVTVPIAAKAPQALALPAAIKAPPVLKAPAVVKTPAIVKAPAVVKAAVAVTAPAIVKAAAAVKAPVGIRGRRFAPAGSWIAEL